MKRVNEPELTVFELQRQGYASSQVGNKRDVAVAGVGATSGAGEEICRVQVAEDAACSWVVTLAPLPPVQQQGALNQNGGVPQIINDAFAIVEWGVGKGRSYAIVDWSVGQQFTVFGSYVSVRGVITSLGAAAVGPAAITSMSAFIAQGRVSRFPQRTVIYGDIGPGGEEVQPVPPFARVAFVSFNQVPVDPSTFASLSVFGQVTAAAGSTIWGATPALAFFTPPVMLNINGVPHNVPMPLPLGTNFLRVNNFDPADTFLAVRMRYELDL